MKSLAVYGIGMFAVLSVAAAQRPAQYPLAWGQYQVHQFGDARRVCVARLGAGPDRPAEVTVLEMMSEGIELRPLFRKTLVTEFIWWQMYSVSGGRFLVTLNDRFVSGSLREQPDGRTPNSIVVYDLVRGTHAAFSASQFLPVEIVQRKDGLDGLYGTGYTLEVRQDFLHITSAREAREHGVPYLVIDLPALKVMTLTPPTPEGEKRLQSEGVDVRLSKPYSWDCSPGKGADSDWLTPLQLPLYLKGQIGVSGGWSALPEGGAKVLCFKWDAGGNTYRRCSEEEWIPRAAPKDGNDAESNSPLKKPPPATR